MQKLIPMKYYKLLNGKLYSHFEENKIYPEDYEDFSTVKNLVDQYSSDWKEVAKEEFLEQESDIMNKQQRIERLEKELNQLKREVEQEQYNFEKGEWITNKNALINIQKELENGYAGYGFGISGWTDNGVWSSIKNGTELRKATKQEIKQALDKERKRRGLVEGVNLNHPTDKLVNARNCCGISGKEVRYNIEEDHFVVGNRTVYFDGKWAELVEQNTIGKYEFEDNSHSIKVGCETFEPYFFTRLQKLCKDQDVFIQLEGADVTNDIINLKL